MLKHDDILRQLTAEQKLALAASVGALEESQYSAMGIPRVHAGRMEEGAAEGLPTFSALANSWDPALVRTAAAVRAAAARNKGISLLYTTTQHLRSDPYRRGMTEDPFLGDAYARSVAYGVQEQGVLPCLTGVSLDACDIDHADREPSKRAVCDYFLRPFAVAAQSSDIAAESDCTRLGGAYDKVNEEAFGRYLRVGAAEDSFVLCSNADYTASMRALDAGKLLVGGDAAWLRQANEDYLRLRQEVYRGERGLDELDRARARGDVLSPETLDRAVDRTISLAEACERLNLRVADPPQEIAAAAAAESIVLLKNQGVLPLAPASRIAVVGGLTAADGSVPRETLARLLSQKKQYAVVGTAAGYDLSETRSDALLKEAAACVRKADTVVLLLGTDAALEADMTARRDMRLPANQLALAAALAADGRRVIAVLSSDLACDMAFDDAMSAVLLAPTGGAAFDQALCDVLTGQICPSGRLAATRYADTDAFFYQRRSDKDTGRNRVGVFVGYRWYDSAGVSVKYPFGFGLSYTTFEYSALKIEGSQIRFTLRNTGQAEGSEVVQIYLGKSDSALVRPAHELKMFAKVTLKAGESTQLSFTVDSASLSFGIGDRTALEGGEYEVSVGASVDDIRLHGKMTAEGRRLEQSGETYADYLQTYTNILEGGYAFSTVHVLREKWTFLRPVGLLILFVMATLALSLLIAGMGGVVQLWQGAALTFFILSIVFAAIGAGMYALGCKLRADAKREAAVVSEADMKSEIKTSKSYDKLFDELFDETELRQTSVRTAEEDTQKRERLAFDPLRTVKVAASELEVFCAERGVALGKFTAAKILASFASSRAVLLRGGSPGLRAKLVAALGEFFGAAPCVEAYNGCLKAEAFLFTPGGRSEADYTAAGQVIARAAQQRSEICFAAVTNVPPASLGSFFMPLSRYVNFPASEEPIVLKEEGQEDIVLRIPSNVWFMFLPPDGVDQTAMDPYTAALACLCDAELTPCGEKQEKTAIAPLSYGQLAGIVRLARDDFWLDEEKSWKRIDKFERFTKAQAGFVIDNKCFVRMEKYASFLLACGMEETAALDHTVAAKLVLPVAASLRAKPAQRRALIEALVSAFGDAGCAACKKALGGAGPAMAR